MHPTQTPPRATAALAGLALAAAACVRQGFQAAPVDLKGRAWGFQTPVPKLDRWSTLPACICQRLVGQIRLPNPLTAVGRSRG